MGTSCLCVLLAVLVSVNVVVSQPIFCDMFCDDDDSSDSSSDEDIFSIWLSLIDPCSSCPTKKPSTTIPPGMQQPVNFVIPPDKGMNVTMTNTGTSWMMNFMPWASKPAASTAAPAATTAAPATTAAGTTAAGGTTAAATTTAKA